MSFILASDARRVTRRTRASHLVRIHNATTCAKKSPHAAILRPHDVARQKISMITFDIRFRAPTIYHCHHAHSALRPEKYRLPVSSSLVLVDKVDISRGPLTHHHSHAHTALSCIPSRAGHQCSLASSCSASSLAFYFRSRTSSRRRFCERKAFVGISTYFRECFLVASCTYFESAMPRFGIAHCL